MEIIVPPTSRAYAAVKEIVVLLYRLKETHTECFFSKIMVSFESITRLRDQTFPLAKQYLCFDKVGIPFIAVEANQSPFVTFGAAISNDPKPPTASAEASHYLIIKNES